MQTRTFLKIHFGIQIFLVLIGIGCGLVAKFIFDLTSNKQFQLKTCPTIKEDSEIVKNPVIITAMFYSVASYGIIQTGTSVLYIIVHILHGFIIKKDLVLLTCFIIIIEILAGLLALVFSGIIHWYSYQSVLYCTETSVQIKHLVYGLPIFIIALCFALLTQMYLCSVLRTVDFFIVIKDPKTPPLPKMEMEVAKSPAIYINRAQLQEVNDAYELLKLQDILRTRLPSLRSQPQNSLVNALEAIKALPPIPHRGMDLSADSFRSSEDFSKANSSV